MANLAILVMVLSMARWRQGKF